MFDIITPIKQAELGDLVFIKKLTKAKGYIIDSQTPLYFISYNTDLQDVTVSFDNLGHACINISLRSISKIVKQEGTVVFQADPRDMVYGQ